MSDGYEKNDFWTNPQETMTMTHGADGAGIIDSAFSLANSAKEHNAAGIALGSVGLALDVLGLVIDPLGSVISAALGWLIDHVTPFRVPLDLLMGDPIGIDAAQAAIDEQKKKLEEDWAPAFDTALTDLKDAWKGEGAQAFQKDMDGLRAHLDALAGYVDTASQQMGIAGGLVGAFRGVIRDIIAGVLGGIIAGAIAAAAAMPFTFGTSVGIFLGTVAATVGITMVKIGEEISKLVQKLTKLLGNLTGLGKAGDDAADAVASAASGGAKPHGDIPGGSGSGPKPDGGGKPEGEGGKTDGTDGTDGKTDGTDGKPEGDGGKTDGTDGKTDGTDGKTDGTDGKPEGDGGKTDGTDGDKPQGDDGWLKLTPDPPANKPPADTGGTGGGKPSESEGGSGDGNWLKLTPDEHPQAKPPESDVKPDGTGGKTDGADGKTDGTGGKTDGADGKTDSTGGKTDGESGHGKPSHEPFPDKMGRYTKDHLTKIIDEKIPNVTPAQRQEIFDKFDKYSNLGKPDLLKLLGPDKAARFENTIKTVTDPAFGGRGFVSKGTIEFIKSLGTVAKEVTPDNSDSSDDSGDS